MCRRQTLLRAPGFQRRAHAADGARGILPSDDGFVEYSFHTALGGEPGDAESVLLSFVRVAMNVDGVLDTDHMIERGIDGSLLEAAAGGIRCYRTNGTRRGIIWIGLGHGHSSLLSIWWDNIASRRTGQLVLRALKASCLWRRR